MAAFSKHTVREGVTRIEVGLIAALIALVVIAGVRGVGTEPSGPYITLSGD